MSEKRIYLSLDTCVWLGLLKIDLHNDDNVFEEICYWIENKFLMHIIPENILREWDRNKVKKTIEIINQIKTLNKTILSPFKANSAFNSIYQSDAIEDVITKRIERIETIFKTHSEIAKEDQDIFNSAIDRNFNCLAPNHSKDSFRDTINILSLINHLKNKGYDKCYFSTINYKDFSADKSKKYNLHTDLIEEFKNANLEYVYFDIDSIGSKLFNSILRPTLPSFQTFLKERENKEQERILAEKKSESETKIDNPDIDYIDNIKYLDMVLLRENPTRFEQMFTKILIESHDSYKQYFFKNIGNNGLV